MEGILTCRNFLTRRLNVKPTDMYNRDQLKQFQRHTTQTLIFNFRAYNSNKERKGMMILTVDWQNGRNSCRRKPGDAGISSFYAHEWWEQFQTMPEFQAFDPVEITTWQPKSRRRSPPTRAEGVKPCRRSGGGGREDWGFEVEMTMALVDLGFNFSQNFFLSFYLVVYFRQNIISIVFSFFKLIWGFN